MRPARTAATTAALRRTTQRCVFGGGRSSLIGVAPSGDCSRALFTRLRRDLGVPERMRTQRGPLLMRPVAGSRIPLERCPVGNRNRALGRQCASCRAAGDPLAADERLNGCFVLFLIHYSYSSASSSLRDSTLWFWT